jgi:hypothetical protein
VKEKKDVHRDLVGEPDGKSHLEELDIDGRVWTVVM